MALVFIFADTGRAMFSDIQWGIKTQFGTHVATRRFGMMKTLAIQTTASTITPTPTCGYNIIVIQKHVRH